MELEIGTEFNTRVSESTEDTEKRTRSIFHNCISGQFPDGQPSGGWVASVNMRSSIRHYGHNRQ